jgi:hypothetical protein
MSWSKRRASLFAALLAIVATITSCGGGTDGTGIQEAFVQGVMTKGSVIVNGIHFDDSTAQVEIDSLSATPADLASGMFVLLRGRINQDGVSGVADMVQVINEVRGSISAVDPVAGTLTVVGQRVLVSSTTIYADVAGIAALEIGQRVEVFGLRDADGTIRASRIERLEEESDDDLRGLVSNLTASTFTLNGVIVNYASAAVRPVGAVIATGQSVEVDGSFDEATGAFTASEVVLREVSGDQVLPGTGDQLELEGYVANLDKALGTFSLNNRLVRYSTSTSFEGGSAANLANNVEVQARGVVDTEGVLRASRIEIKQGD